MRVPNWDVALHHWAREVVGKPYVWGETDCGSLVRQAYALMYGRECFDVKPYTTKRQAIARNKKTGGVEASLRAYGCVEVRLGFEQQGDVICEPDSGHGFAGCGVVVGREVIMADAETGVTRVPVRSVDGVVLRG